MHQQERTNKGKKRKRKGVNKHQLYRKYILYIFYSSTGYYNEILIQKICFASKHH